MTGFARAEGSLDGFSWGWELKSVNSKSLDLRLRLPSGYDRLEPQLRTSLAARIKRGNVGATLTLVSAPAGFGKTTLLAGWLVEWVAAAPASGRAAAWLSLDQGDNHCQWMALPPHLQIHFLVGSTIAQLSG